MSLVEEDVAFGLVTDEGTEVFANHAVPVRSILLIEFDFDMFGHQVFHFEVVDCVLGLEIEARVPRAWPRLSCLNRRASR